MTKHTTTKRSFLGKRPLRTLLIAPLIPALAVGAYIVIYTAVPGYGEYARAGLASLFSKDLQHAIGMYAERITEVDGRLMLWGGHEAGMDFDVMEFRLEPQQLHYGLGREYFRALIEPEFVSPGETDDWDWFEDESRVLVVTVGNVVKVYPLFVLRAHEVVNDTVGGQPIFAAYCVLADLAAVYDRRLDDDHVLTFGVSGYTYADPAVWNGDQAFVLWDRDTESLWWPPIGRAVSGPLMDVPMRLVDERYWAQMSWGEARHQYPKALVLDRDQVMDTPGDWPRLEADKLDVARLAVEEVGPDDSIAPQWGDNESIQQGGTVVPSPRSRPG